MDNVSSWWRRPLTAGGPIPDFVDGVASLNWLPNATRVYCIGCTGRFRARIEGGAATRRRHLTTRPTMKWLLQSTSQARRPLPRQFLF